MNTLYYYTKIFLYKNRYYIESILCTLFLVYTTIFDYKEYTEFTLIDIVIRVLAVSIPIFRIIYRDYNIYSPRIFIGSTILFIIDLGVILHKDLKLDPYYVNIIYSSTLMILISIILLTKYVRIK